MPGLWSVLLGLVFALPLVLVAVLGEQFHQLRSFLDQDKYLKPTNNINVVRDLTDAEFVLFKYGYLVCKVPRARRKREAPFLPHSPDMASRTPSAKRSEHKSWLTGMEEGGGVDGCEKAEVQKAILDYQSTYNLPLTGKLDKETMSLMSTSRCGNKDSAKDSVESSELQSDNGVEIKDSSSQDGENKEPPSSSSSSSSHRIWRRSASVRNSRLYSILSPSTYSKPRPVSAHREYLVEFIKKERLKQRLSGKSVQDVNRRWRSLLLHRYTRGERRKRSVHVKMLKRNIDQGSPLIFTKKVLLWRLLNTGFSTRIPLINQRASLELAFRMWSEVIPVKFVEDQDSHIAAVDILIAFGKGFHQNCRHQFDGNGGEIAHSWNLGDMHFDDDESYRSLGSLGIDGIYLLRVAVHEIGHVLGLAHTNNSQSIMYAIYRGAQLDAEFELSRADRRDIQELYGVCKGSFNTVFDWVRKGPNQKFIYNTYFFRSNHYWMYENHANRTRYGDPLYVALEWSGVPNNIDGYVHVWIFSSGLMIDHAYFFKGKHYYKYNSFNDTVIEGWPRLISEDFGPKVGQTVGVPSHLDSVFFDTRDGNIYFFKGEDVYVYNPVAPDDEKGCCERVTTLQEEFPPAEGELPLPSHLDAVYYSYRDKMQYFIKGEDYWRNKLFDPRQRYTHNNIEYMGKWYNKWLDICDVQAMDEH